jgi:sulfite reductase alpha subunit-like flavoprotein
MKTVADALKDVSHAVLPSQLVLNLLRSLNPRFSSTADNIADTTPLHDFMPLAPLPAALRVALPLLALA